MINNVKHLSWLAVAGVLFAAACSDDEGKDGNIGEVDTGQISVIPNPVQFPDVPLGGSQEETIIISNVGDGTLNITSIELVEDTDSDAGGVEFQKGTWQNTAEIAPGDQIILTIAYSPLDQNPDNGRLIIKSNDPDGDLEVPIQTADLAPSISSTPVVNFPRVAPVTETTRNKSWQFLDVQNIGLAPLEISRVVVSPADSDFSISFPENKDVMVDPATDGTEPPSTVAPDEIFPVRVYFNPQDNLPSSADLIFFSNDPEKGQYTVSLQGNSGAPCMRLSREDEINFGEGGIGYANSRTITIENCSPTQDLKVSEISITDDGGGVFDLRDGSLPEGLPDAEAVIPPDNTANFVVTYTPTAEIVSTGELTVRSNDPSKANLRVPIVGKGTTNVCPQAIAQGRIQEQNGTAIGPYRQQLNTIPLKYIGFDATQSTDPNGSIASYEWTIVQRPPNSTARLETSNTVPQPTMFLDLAGTYIVELTVYDDQGLSSCNDDETRRVTILATPDEDIHVQLVWDTPTDADQEDTFGTDLDLHYLHPNGRWNNAPWDIFWRNRTSDWGSSGAADDPSLDIDDTDGSGPENVNHNNPESGLSYQVGVYYYADKGFGPSYATLRIYIQGQQRYEWRNEYLASTGTFWRAAAISWPSGSITALNQKQQGFPGTTP